MIMIAASFCKADVIKFQKRTPRELLSPEAYAAPHPNPMHAYGATYGEHRERLEFTAAQHRELQTCCAQYGATYGASVWDLTSAREIIALSPAYLKIPSACNLDLQLLALIANEYAGDLHVSLGMTTRAEEERLVAELERLGLARRTILYSCTSGYPVAFEDICLEEITRLRETYTHRVKEIGFSGHHLGIAADIAAITLGARWVERHFTLDRTAKGTDHAASLEPDGLRRLARDIRNVSKALRPKPAEILDIEFAQRAKLKRNVTPSSPAP
jgi:N-acetylneuraminate synthase